MNGPASTRWLIVLAAVGVAGLVGSNLLQCLPDRSTPARWLPEAGRLPGSVRILEARYLPAAGRIDLVLAVEADHGRAEYAAAIWPKGYGPSPFRCSLRHCVNYRSKTGHEEQTPEALTLALETLVAHLRVLEARGESVTASGWSRTARRLGMLGLVLACLGAVAGILRAPVADRPPGNRRRLDALVLAALLVPTAAAALLRVEAISPGLSEDERVPLGEVFGVAGETRVPDEGLPQPAQNALLWACGAMGLERRGMQAAVLALSLLIVIASSLLYRASDEQHSPRLVAVGVAATGLVVAMSPVLIIYSAKILGYTLGCAAGALAVLALQHAGSRPRPGWLLFLVLAGIAGAAHPLAIVPPAAALLVRGVSAVREQRSAEVTRAIAATLGLAAVGLALLPRLVVTLGFHLSQGPTPVPVLAGMKVLLGKSFGLAPWLLLAVVALTLVSARARRQLAFAALLAGLAAPLAISPYVRIEGRHFLFAVPFLAVLAGRAASVLVRSCSTAVGQWRNRAPWSARLRSTGLALGLCVLFCAGIRGHAEALPGAVHHQTRAVARLARHVGDREASLVISPRHAATPFIDAALDPSPRQLARFVFEAHRRADRVEWKYRSAAPAADERLDLVAVDPRDFHGAVEARLKAGKHVWAVAMPAQLGSASAGAGCRPARQEAPFTLWRCEPY